MERRKALFIAFVVVYMAIFLMGFLGSRDGVLVISLIGLLLVLPLFSCRYAVMDLQRESYLSWFFLSMLPHVPIILMLEKPVGKPEFFPNMKLGGQEASAYGLGELTHFYTVRAHSQLGWKIASFFLAFMMAPIVVLPFLTKENASGTLGNLLPFVFVIAVGTLFLWLINKQEKRTGQRWVALFSEGLACAWPDQEIKKLKWEDVLEVWQDFRDQYVNGIRTVHRRRCRLQATALKQGIEFTEKILGIEELTANVHEQVTPFLISRMEKVLGAGQNLEFGKLSLSSQGVALKKNVLPWSDLGGIYLDSGFVVIARQAQSSSEARIKKSTQGLSAFATRIVGTAQPYAPGGDTVIWKKTPVDQTPNPYTLMVLVSEIMQKISPQAMA